MAFRRIVAACLLMACATLAHAGPKAPIRVLVASESWDHLIYAGADNVPHGDFADFVRRMNEIQDTFRFELAIYPRLRLNEVFARGQADVYPLRTVAWTEPELGLAPTRTIIESGDIYFARRDNHYGGPKVFDDPKSRLIAGVRGYHYQLFDNDPVEAHIRRKFKATLLNSNTAVVQFVLADRADIGIVPAVILARYLQDPATRERIIVGPFDSRVQLSNLVRKGGPISVEQMNAIVDKLVASGDVARLREKLSAGQSPPAKARP
jgi:ABC-type amino acid transport substrate-binding protein